jgi:uncharacterized DUF497 family protein
VRALTVEDPVHSEDEDRFVTVGVASNGDMLTVVHTERGENTRLISARLASRQERKQYESQP